MTGPRRGAPAGRRFKAKGQGVTYPLTAAFRGAAKDAKLRVTMADGWTLDITSPPGAGDRQMLRPDGQGMPGFGGAAAVVAPIALPSPAGAAGLRRD